MENELIKTHNFEVAKQEIKTLSEKVPQKVELPQVAVTKLWIFNHKVTGSEFNTLVSTLQSTFVESNTRMRELYSEFNKIYKAFDALDKDYIQGILSTLAAATIASDQAKAASTKALEANLKTEVAQEDLKKTIEALKATVHALKEFKDSVNQRLSTLSNSDATNLTKHDSSFMSGINEKLLSLEHLIESYNHLDDIDTIWSTVEIHKSDLVSLYSQVDDFRKYVQQTAQQINESINILEAFRTQSESYVHLKDVDAIWNDVEEYKTNIFNLHQQLEAFVIKSEDSIHQMQNDISSLEEYRTILESYVHLKDVDAIWDDVEEHKTDLHNLHHQLDAFVQKTEESILQMQNGISALEQYRAILESYVHLKDIDVIWNDVEEHKTDLLNLHNQLNAFVLKTEESILKMQNAISALEQYRAILESYVHLKDVDAIWNDVEMHKIDLLNLHQQLDAFIDTTNTSICEIWKRIEKEKNENQIEHIKHEKKIKIAYAIGASAIGFSMIQFILQLFGIL